MVINRFYFSDGKSAGNLEEFLEKLRLIDDECFRHHVNKEKNDFAIWISDAVKDKTLGKKIKGLDDKRKIIFAINRKVYSPTKIKRRIISQIKEAISDGTS